MVGAEAEVDLAHAFEAAQQEAGGGEKDHGDGDLGDDKGGAEAGVAAAGGSGASTLLEGVVEAGVGGGEGGGEAAEDAGQDGESESEGDDLPVETDFADAWERLGKEADADAKGCRGEGEAENATGEADDEAFQHGLTEEGGGGGSEGEANGHLAAAADGANEKKTGEVGAGDEEDDGDGEEEGADERAGLFDGLFLERAGRWYGCGRSTSWAGSRA